MKSKSQGRIVEWVFPEGSDMSLHFPCVAGQWERLNYETTGYGFNAQAVCVSAGIAAQYSDRQMALAADVYAAISEITPDELAEVAAQREEKRAGGHQYPYDAFAGVEVADGTALEDLSAEQLAKVRQNLARANARFKEVI